MSRDTVEKLLATSHAIDQMRVETDQVVRTVLGLIQKSNQWKGSVELDSRLFLPTGGYWEWGVLHHTLHARYVGAVVDDDRFIVNDRKALLVDYSSASNWINGVRFRNRIDGPWKTLPEFVDWAQSKFPELKTEMQSFFERGMMA